MKRWVAVSLMAISTLSFTGPALLTGKTLAATDILVSRAPFAEREAKQPRFRTAAQTDQVEQLALVAEFWGSLRQGRVQLWEPDVGGGVPLFTAVYNRVLAPWFISFLFLPAAIAPTVATAIAIFVAQLGTYGLARRLKLGRGPAVFAAVAYAFSGPATGYILRIHEIFLLPALLYALHGLIVDRRARYLVLTALVTAATWFGGYPSAAMIVFYLAGAWAIYLCVTASTTARDAWRRAWPAIVAAAAGTAITAVQLLTSLQYLGVTGALDRTYGPEDALGLRWLATAVSGRFFGAFQERDWWPNGEFRPMGTSSTVGVVLLASLVVVVSRRQTRGSTDCESALRRFLLPVGLVVAVASFIGGPVLWAIQQLPFLDSNPFHRARFIPALVLAIAGGFAVDHLTERERPTRTASRAVRVQVGILLAMIAVGLVAGVDAAARARALDVVARNIVVPAAVLLALLAIVWIGRRSPTFVAIAAVTALTVELQWGAWGATPAVAASAFYPRDPAVARLEHDLGPGGGFRFLASEFGTFRPMASAYADVRDVRVAFPAHERYRDLLRLADPRVFERGRLKTFFTDELDPSSPALDAMSARYLLDTLATPVREAGPARALTVPRGELPISFRGTVGPGRMRALRIPLDVDCKQGWVELSMDTDGRRITVRRTAREIAGVTQFPLPDIGREGHPFDARVEATHCRGRLTGSRIGVVPPLPDSRLVVRDTDGWIAYERVGARPRVDVPRSWSRIEDEAERLSSIRTRAPDAPVVVEGVPSGTGGGSARIVRDDPDEVVIEAKARAATLVVLRDTVAPGWKVTVNGKRAQLVVVDHAFRGVMVPAGTSAVRFHYRPTLYTAGLLAAMAGALATVIAAAVVRRRDRHDR